MDRIAIIVLGLLAGSFLNVCIYRLPRGISLVRPRSRCPRCGHAVGAWENIPILGYLLLRGRCRGCAAAISIRYPLIEALTAGAFLLAYLRYGAAPEFLRFAFFLVAMLALICTDYDWHQLPDEITLGGLVVGCVFAFWVPGAAVSAGNAVAGALLGAGILWLIGEGYFRLRGRPGMGLGDVKMMACVGAFLGWQRTLTTLVLAALAGTLVGLTLAGLVFARRVLRARSRGRSWPAATGAARASIGAFFTRRALPFGVFLGGMAAASWLWGQPLWTWYLRLAQH